MMLELNSLAVNPRKIFIYGEYIFRYGEDLKPVPLEVPSYVADILLQMTGRVSSCCGPKVPPPLFRVVK